MTLAQPLAVTKTGPGVPPRARIVMGRSAVLPALTLLVIAIGAAFRLSPQGSHLADPVWTAGLVLFGGRVVWQTMRQAARGHFATDLVASMAIVTAVVIGMPLPGLIVVLMQTGGEALEEYARGRASEAVRALEEAAPRMAHRMEGDAVADVAVDAVAAGDILLVRPGELIPCDVIVESGTSHVDTSQLTGEPVPVRAEPGVALMSGSLNGEQSFTARATAPASESQYARIVELVRSAQASKAPLQRLADKYAVWFTPITILVSAAAWAASGDATRVLAILVVATPCPLILAAPVAIIGGINRAARRQIIFRHGGALEQLGTVNVAVFDKTGTLTVGLPSVARVVAVDGVEGSELLSLAAAVEQASSHLLARTVVQAAVDAGITLPAITHVSEVPGRGVAGDVGGREVAVGARSWILERSPDAAAAVAALDARSHGLRAFVTIDGVPSGVIEFADRIRPGADRIFADLRALGISRMLLLSGDDSQQTSEIAQAVGIDDARGDLLPGDKAATVERMVADGDRVLMVGDGTNDAPALGTATVGIALAGHGGGITAEAADVVLLVDDIDRIAVAIRISRRTLRIARQSIWVGLGLSGVAMGFAAFGLIPPIAGALIQEAIDVAVILNALRASR